MNIVGKLFIVTIVIITVLFPSHDVYSETDILDFIPAIIASGTRLPTAYSQAVSTRQGDDADITLTGKNPYDGSLTFAVLAQPQNGTLSGSLPNLTYSPQESYIGKDRFTFAVTNRNRSSEAANIDIYVIDPDNFLQNLIVEFGPYDSETGHAGAFVFRPNYEKVFLEFGKDVISDHQGNLKDNPAFEYLIALDANVISPVNATVTNMIFQESSQDYELHLAPIDINDMWISIDHVKNPTVVVDEVVTAGHVLGNPGTWDSYVGRVEIQIILTMEGESVCPFLYFDPDTRALYESKVSQLIEDWETYKADSQIYSEENFPITGCRTATTGM
jgi:hypothetical protein